jgi:hypothetical protein
MRRILFPSLLLLSLGAHAADDPEGPANWISNPSFEVGSQACPVDWVFFNQHETTTGAWDGSAARSGAAGVAVRGAGGLAFGRWITPYGIPLEPGQRYRYAYWYRGTGAQVYVQGRASSLTPEGLYTVDLARRFKTPLGATPATTEWTRVAGEFVAPGYPSWAQLCLSGSGRDHCAFDDVFLSRPGLLVLEPRVPQVLPVGATVRLSLYAEELRDLEPAAVQWKVESGNFSLRTVERDPVRRCWNLQLEATRAGVADVAVQAARSGGTPLALQLPRWARVHDGTGGAFAFAALTDLHFYRPGRNERNEIFGRLADTLNALDPLFALSLGDQMEIHSGYRDEEKKQEVEAVREQLARVRVPLFQLAGNHEIDKSYEGAGTQWYAGKLLQVAPHFALEVDGALLAGVDLTAPGLCDREHGAAFLRAGQAEWLEGVLGSYTGRLPVLAGHVPPYNEFSESADRDQFLALLFKHRVRAFLAGHLHYTKDEWVRNPAADGAVRPPWPAPQPLARSADGTRRLADPANTVFLTTTTGSAFLLGGYPFNGYRYLLVRDQQIVWQDVLPVSLGIARSEPAPNVVTYAVSNGPHKAVSALPLRADLPPGRVQATLDGAPLPVQVTTNGAGRLVAWVQPDIATNRTVTVTLRSDR